MYILNHILKRFTNRQHLIKMVKPASCKALRVCCWSAWAIASANYDFVCAVLGFDNAETALQDCLAVKSAPRDVVNRCVCLPVVCLYLLDGGGWAANVSHCLVVKYSGWG